MKIFLSFSTLVALSATASLPIPARAAEGGDWNLAKARLLALAAPSTDSRAAFVRGNALAENSVGRLRSEPVLDRDNRYSVPGGSSSIDLGALPIAAFRTSAGISDLDVAKNLYSGSDPAAGLDAWENESRNADLAPAVRAALVDLVNAPAREIRVELESLQVTSSVYEIDLAIYVEHTDADGKPETVRFASYLTSSSDARVLDEFVSRAQSR